MHLDSLEHSAFLLNISYYLHHWYSTHLLSLACRSTAEELYPYSRTKNVILIHPEIPPCMIESPMQYFPPTSTCTAFDRLPGYPGISVITASTAVLYGCMRITRSDYLLGTVPGTVPYYRTYETAVGGYGVCTVRSLKNPCRHPKTFGFDVAEGRI